jgi:predicted Rossmann fold nucleotide-binding protein DprA/Smf involved in DNA uptake
VAIVHLGQDDPHYPAALKAHLGEQAPALVTALGNLDILRNKTVAVFCSVKCPGSLILQTYDLAQHWRQAGVTVIGGFHSPTERECLTILLRGTQPIIICPARSMQGMRVRAEYKKPLEQGRLLLLSPFAETPRRITAEMAVTRNRFVAALADAIFVAHAEPKSMTEQFCRDILVRRKVLYTLESEANAHLIALGAKPFTAPPQPGCRGSFP